MMLINRPYNNRVKLKIHHGLGLRFITVFKPNVKFATHHMQALIDSGILKNKFISDPRYLASEEFSEILDFIIESQRIYREHIEAQIESENSCSNNSINIENIISQDPIEHMWHKAIIYYMELMNGEASLGSVITLFHKFCVQSITFKISSNEANKWIQSNIHKYSVTKSQLSLKDYRNVKAYNKVNIALLKETDKIKIDALKLQLKYLEPKFNNLNNRFHYVIGFKYTKSEIKYSNFPMFVSPENYRLNPINGLYYGGSLNNAKHNIEPLFNASKNNDAKNMGIHPNMIKIINILQRIPYKISVEIIDSLIEDFRNQIVSHTKNVKSEKLLAMLINPIRYKLNSLSKLRDFVKDNNIDKFFCPMRIDFRGRGYSSSILSFTNTPETRKIPFFELQGKPVSQFDATGSFLQIWAMGLFSEDLMIATNIIDQKHPSDPYSILFPLKNEYSLDDKTHFQNILNNYCDTFKQPSVNIDTIWNSIYTISRNDVKMTLMTWIYGSNLYSIWGLINATNKRIKYNHIVLILASFLDKLPFEFECIMHIKELYSMILKDNNEPWIASNHLMIFNNLYYKNLKSSLELKIKDTKIEVSYNQDDTVIDTKKSIGSIIANLTHNIDSGIILSAAIWSLLENSPCKTVHDCIISTNPNIARENYAAAIYSNRGFYMQALQNNVRRLKHYDYIRGVEGAVKPKYLRKTTLTKYIDMIQKTADIIGTIREREAVIDNKHKINILKSRNILKREF